MRKAVWGRAPRHLQCCCHEEMAASEREIHQDKNQEDTSNENDLNINHIFLPKFYYEYAVKIKSE
jgi:hypothetical protein